MYLKTHGALWLACVFLSGDLCAQDTPPDQGASSLPISREIFVPYKDLAKTLATPKDERGTFLSQRKLEEILTWIEKTEATAKTPDTPAVKVHGATLQGRVEGNHLQLDLKFTLTKQTNATWASFILGPRELPITQVSEGSSFLTYHQDATEIWISDPEEQVVALTLRYPIETENDRHRATLTLPRLPLQEIALQIPGIDWEIETTPTIASTTQHLDDSTEIKLAPGGMDGLILHWRKTSTPPLPHVGVTTVTHASIQASHVQLSCESTLHIQRAPITQTSIQIPQDYQFLQLDAPTDGQWTLENQLLTVIFQEAIQGKHQIRFTLLTPLPDLPTNYTFAPCLYMGSHHQHGEIHLWRSNEIAASTPTGTALFSAALPVLRPLGHWIASYRYPMLPFTLELPLALAMPRVALASETAWTVRPEAHTLDSTIRYQVSERPIHTLTLKLPPNYGNIAVSGDAVMNHRVSDGNLIVAFKSPQIGSGTFRISAVRQTEDLVQIETPIIQCPESAAHEGRVAVLAENAYDLRTVEVGDCVAIDANTTLLTSTNQGSNAPRFGFRYRGATPTPATLEITTRDPRVTVEVGIESRVEDHQMLHQWNFNYQIRHAPTRDLYLAVPKAHAEALQLHDERVKEITRTPTELEPALPEAFQETHDRWHLAFREGQQGALGIQATLTEALDSEEESFTKEMPLLFPLDVAAAPGTLGIYPTGALEVIPQSVTDLDAVDPSELTKGHAAHAFRFRQAPYQLTLAIQRHQLFAVPRVLIPYAETNVALAEDGGSTTEFVLLLKNRTERHLTLTLPEGARLSADVLVDGDVQAPRRQEGSDQLIIALPEKSDPITIRLFYHLTPENASQSIPVPTTINGRILRSVTNLYVPGSRRYHVKSSAMQLVTKDRGWDRFRDLCQALVPALGNHREPTELSAIARPAALLQDQRKEWASFRPDQSQRLQLHRLGAPGEIVLRSSSALFSNALEALFFILTIALGRFLVRKGRAWHLPYVAGGTLILSGLVSPHLVPTFQIITLGMLIVLIVHGVVRLLRKASFRQLAPATA